MKRLLTLMAVCAGIACAACGAPQSAPSQPKPAKVIKIGAFRVRRIVIPRALVNGSPTYQIGPNTMVRVGDSAPYVLQRRPLTSGRWETVYRCAQPLIGTDINGPLTGFLCPAPPGASTQRNRVILFDPQGQPRTYSLPVRLPTSRQWLQVVGYVFGGKEGSLAWLAAEDYPVGQRDLGSGLIDLAAGKSKAAPAAITLDMRQTWNGFYQMPGGMPYLSPSDELFLVGSSAREGGYVPVYRWSRVIAKLTPLGEVPLYETLAVGDDSTLWALRPAFSPPESQQSVYFLREVPSGGRVQSWRIDGQVLGGGPGYVVYVPKSDPASLDIFFPLQHRTLQYRKLNDPGKMLRLAVLWQVDAKMQVVVSGEGAKAVEIQISR